MFHYFFPGRKLTKITVDGVTKQVVGENLFSDFGLDDSIGDLTESHKYTAFESTFSGVRGIFLTPYVGGVPAPSHTYDPDNQFWHTLELENGVNLFVGWTKKHPPSPATLIRDNRFPGYEVTGADENMWLIPTARSDRGQITLPNQYVFDLKHGGVKKELDDRFESIWEASGIVFDRGMAGEQLSDFELATIALEGLSLNYRIGRAEHNAMTAGGIKVLTSHVAHSICDCLIDLHFIRRLEDEKKTGDPVDESSLGDSGSQDTTPDTDQAATS